MSEQISQEGSLVVVGTGINTMYHTTISAKMHIETADIVYAVVSDLGMSWLRKLNENVVSLTDLYEEQKSRVKTYKEMATAIADSVREGKRVCAVYYGHPGVFVSPTHRVVKQLQEEGYQASMDPGISAEDCMVADLGIDPGNTGCQALEATQFLFYKHQINPHNLLIVWQICLSGDHTLRSLSHEGRRPGLVVLRDALLKHYPSEHEVIVYEASSMTLVPPRIDRMPLRDLPDCKPTLASTLVIPSLGLPEFDHETLAELGLTAEQVVESMKLPDPGTQIVS